MTLNQTYTFQLLDVVLLGEDDLQPQLPIPGNNNQTLVLPPGKTETEQVYFIVLQKKIVRDIKG